MDSGRQVISAFGVRIPGVIYGTAWKKERTAALVRQALESGFRGLDTACQPKHYNESGVGEGLERCFEAGLSRNEVYLQSKFTPLAGQDPTRIPFDPAAPLADQVTQSFAASLKNLRTDYLDCLLLHSPLPEVELIEVWKAMEAIFRAGGARQLGICNCYGLEQFQFILREADVKPAVLQNRFYADTGYDKALRAICQEHGVHYQSFWTLTANPHLLASRVVESAAAAHRRTPAQVLFRYLTHVGVTPLTGTTSQVHIREDLAIFEFELSQGEVAAITGLL